MLVRAIRRPQHGFYSACDTSPIAPRSLLGGRFASGSRSSRIVLLLRRVLRGASMSGAQTQRTRP
jgi:hypothetical protein